MQIILASSSPRRAEILRVAGIAFEACPVHVDETRYPEESAEAMVARLAEAKACAASLVVGASKDCIIVGADTVVELDDKIYGKPRDAAHAAEMLGNLSGRTHQVLSGIFLLRLPAGNTRKAVETTSVALVPLDRREIDGYVATGEPMDKAGAYAIQGLAARYIPRIEGCYFNVVGLPLARLHRLLQDLGWKNSQDILK